MTAGLKWVDRKFMFDFPVDLYPEIIERLRGTPLRADDLTRSVPHDLLKFKSGKSWSIQEHVGHLVSVEWLVKARLDDYDAGKSELTAADMTNRRTEDARYHDRTMDTILAALRQARAITLGRLEALKPTDFTRTAWHPRLQVPMRLVDTMYFFAEHDDYHLARIRALIRSFESKEKRR